jgi:hypothetical protein
VIDFPVYNKIPDCPDDNLVYTFKVDGEESNESWLGINFETKTLNLAPEFPSNVGVMVLLASVKTDGLGEAENSEFTVTVNVREGTGGFNTKPGPIFDSPGLAN